MIEPIKLTPQQLSGWTDRKPLAFSLALFLARRAPRGQAWFSRKIGRWMCGGMRLVLRTAHGAWIAVDPYSLDYYTLMVKGGGIVDTHVRDACLQVMSAGDVFYDIGANAGLMSVEVAAHFEGNLRVCAFEPQPNLALTTAVSGARNNFRDWTVFSAMLGSKTGTADLFVPECSYHASALSRRPGAKRVTCPVTTLDELVEAGRIPPPDVIKIDVEGGEFDVFSGGLRTLHTYAPSIIFESSLNSARFGYTRADLMKLLQEAAPYEFFIVGGPELVPVYSHERETADADILAVTWDRPRKSEGSNS